MTFKRITTNSNVCTGKPCIRNLRFPVSRLLGLLAAGETQEAILKACPYLEAEDISEALRFAASLAEEETIELADEIPDRHAPLSEGELRQSVVVVERTRIRKRPLPIRSP